MMCCKVLTTSDRKLPTMIGEAWVGKETGHLSSSWVGVGRRIKRH